MIKMKVVFVKASEITPKNLQKISLDWTEDFVNSKICEDLKILNNDYPGILEWYTSKVKPEIEKGNKSREIILAFADKELAGIAILKKDNYEKKICTIRIREIYRKKGIGRRLFEEAFEWLETRLPLITISETNQRDFLKIISDYEFKETDVIIGKYVKNKKEYIYNGN